MYLCKMVNKFHIMYMQKNPLLKFYVTSIGLYVNFDTTKCLAPSANYVSSIRLQFNLNALKTLGLFIIKFLLSSAKIGSLK